jgi:hypothetical protein
MRRFAFLCVVAGILVALGVCAWADITFQAFANSTDYGTWRMLSAYDRATWQPGRLRTAASRDACRWPAVGGGGALATFGVVLLAIRRSEPRVGAER